MPARMFGIRLTAKKPQNSRLIMTLALQMSDVRHL